MAFLLETDKRFLNPDKQSRKAIMEMLSIDKKYHRAFDLISIPEHTNLEEIILINKPDEIVLIELKTTMKRLDNLLSGFFFGATKNEFDLAEKLGNKYLFCFVSLHKKTSKHVLLSYEELKVRIKTKRIQYQINLI